MYYILIQNYFGFRYGWFHKLSIPRNLDKRLHFPVKESSFIKTELLIKVRQKYVPEKPFVGTPFHLM